MNRVLFLLLFIPAIPEALFAQSPLQYVDPLIGTAPATTVFASKHSELGSEIKGQTYPAVGRPFAMTQWTPETQLTEGKCISPYYYNDKIITGFRGTHWMNGSCTQDYGTFTLMPFSGNKADAIKISPTSKYSHSNETASPAYYSVLLDDFGIRAELTGSVRSGMMRFTFSGKEHSDVFIRINSDRKEGEIWIDKKNNLIVGYNPVHRIYQGWGQPAGFSGYFVIQFNKPFTSVVPDSSSQDLMVDFGKEKTVLVKIGTSFTSIAAARNNLNTEITGWKFDELRKTSEKVWNETLNKIQVTGGTKDDRVKFYTGLYHCYQLPRIVSDIDGSYPGFAQDTAVHKAVGFEYYDDFSMWDTYRSLHPLMTILEPKRTLDMVKSLIAKAEQGGWMPIFPCWNSYTAEMIGDHVSTMISDAYMKRIKDFDTETAYRYMRQNAFEQPSAEEYKDGKGRRALTSYMKYGYIPLEDSVWEAFHRREQVSRTLEYAFDDYALAQFAKSIGKIDDYNVLMKRSQNYRNVFDVKTGYVRGRYIDGSWIAPFDPTKNADYICEGTPFQYTWYVPQDIPGLIDLMGGKLAFLKRLNAFFEGGHYWHGNEPDHQASYLFALAGDASKTQEWVRRIIDEEYGTGPGGLSGNEDAGQMSAWLVCSMMGFYPVCPAKGEYVLSSPSFDEIKIQSNSKAKPFVIKAVGYTPGSPYVRSMQLNHAPFTGCTLQHAQIVEGGELIMNMSGK